MSLSADLLKKMRDMGLTIDQAIELFDAMTVKEPSAAARRQRAYRERQAITRDVTDNATRDATQVTQPPPSPSLPPQTPPTHPLAPPDITTRAREEAAFGRFWSAYPRKTSKADARKAFAKAWRKLPPMDEEQILTGGLERAKANWTDAQFIPHAATWLNGERWNDEAAEIIPISAGRQNGPPDRPYRDAKFAARQDNLARHERGFELAARLHDADRG